jgi:hypothetical protein
MTWPRRLAAVTLLAFSAAGCGLIPEAQVGLACQEPPGPEVPIDAIGPPDVIGLAPQEAAARLDMADIRTEITWRYHYSTEAGGGPTGYSECWCIPPPDGHVSQAEYIETGQLLVMVERDEPMVGGRPQPTLGWGCSAEG